MEAVAPQILYRPIGYKPCYRSRTLSEVFFWACFCKEAPMITSGSVIPLPPAPKAFGTVAPACHAEALCAGGSLGEDGHFSACCTQTQPATTRPAKAYARRPFEKLRTLWRA